MRRFVAPLAVVGSVIMKPTSRIALGALVFQLFTGATAHSQQIHPDARFSINRSTAAVIKFGSRSSAPIFRLDNSRSWRAGTEEGDGSLGAIAGAAFNSVGDLIVLDRGSDQFLVYDSTGRILQIVGQSGTGPSDFQTPVALAVGPKDELAIADLSRRIQFFERKGGKYVLTRTLTPNLSIRALCFVKGKLVVNGRIPGDPRVLRVVNVETGAIESSFGAIYRSSNQLIDLMLTEGMLACDNAQERIVFATNSGLGEIRAYDLKGNQMWFSYISDFMSNKLIEQGTSGYQVESSPTGVNALHSLVIIPGVGIAAQYSHRSRQELKDREGAKATYTVVFDSRSGRARISSFRYPVLGAVRNHFVAAVSDDPFPQVHVMRLAK